MKSASVKNPLLPSNMPADTVVSMLVSSFLVDSSPSASEPGDDTAETETLVNATPNPTIEPKANDARVLLGLTQPASMSAPKTTGKHMSDKMQKKQKMQKQNICLADQFHKSE